MSKRRLSPTELRERILDPRTKVVMASSQEIASLRPYVDRVLMAVQAVTGSGGAVWLSDASRLSDFFIRDRDRAQDQRLYDRIGEKLGIRLDGGNEDDDLIVRVARRLKCTVSSTN